MADGSDADTKQCHDCSDQSLTCGGSNSDAEESVECTEQCSTCGAAADPPHGGGGTKKKLLKCGACRADGVRYCSRACQRSDWPRHRTEEGCTGKVRRLLSPLESLPPDVFRFVLEHLKLPSMVLLGSCSRALQREVYVRNKWPWVDLNFGMLDAKLVVRLTDDGLRGLLTRIRASKTVRTLSLLNCKGVKGLGLDPLKKSRVLEEIDLRLEHGHYDTFGDTGLDDKFVLSVLSTMPPIAGPPGRQQGLRVVQIRRQDDVDNVFQRFNKDIMAWMLRFMQAKTLFVASSWSRCGSCKDTVFGRIKSQCSGETQTATETGAAIVLKASKSWCMSCKCYTCGTGDCPSAPMECNRCLKVFCGEDGCEIDPCSECDYYHCSDCVYSATCSVCCEPFCENCMNISSCSTCYKAFCEPCEFESGLMFCECCYESHCLDCDEFNFCAGCECNFCADCSSDFSPPCGLCSKRFCDEDCQAQDMTFCDACDQHFCADCDGIFSCLGCGEGVLSI